MAVGNKYVALAPVHTFQALGSTVVLDLAPFSKDLSIDENVAEAEVTGYSDEDMVYTPGKGDKSASWTQWLEDGYDLEDALTKGAFGTVIWGPNGSENGMKRITIVGFVAQRPRTYPLTEGASMEITFRPTQTVVEDTFSA
ncbi:MAG: hypothetical protein AB7R89_06215 [Dehalococcoidia bacterium]